MSRFCIQFVPRLIVWTLIFLALLLMTQSGQAAPIEDPAKPKPQESQKAATKQVRQVPKTLDDWFRVLEVAPNREAAKLAEKQIIQMWLATDSPTLGVLMSRVNAMLDQKHLGAYSEEVFKMLAAIIKTNPEYFPARALRAQLNYQKGNIGEALLDIRFVLSREPRHFQALLGLGLILQGIGEQKKALEVYRRLQKIYPRIEHVPEFIKQLEVPVEGRDI